MRWKRENGSKVVVILIHQTVGLGVSTTAARRQLVIASAAGDEARAGRRQDDEDVLSKNKICQRGAETTFSPHTERLAGSGWLTETKAKMPAQRV